MATILRSNKTLDTMRAYKARSLNKAQRRRKLMKITEENQQILRRIQSSEVTYTPSGSRVYTTPANLTRLLLCHHT